MSAKNTAAITDPQTALKIVDALEKQAAKTQDPQLKRILLSSGCDIIDLVLRQHNHAKAA